MPFSLHCSPSSVARPWRAMSVWRFDHGAAEACLRHVVAHAVAWRRLGPGGPTTLWVERVSLGGAATRNPCRRVHPRPQQEVCEICGLGPCRHRRCQGTRPIRSGQECHRTLPVAAQGVGTGVPCLRPGRSLHRTAGREEPCVRDCMGNPGGSRLDTAERSADLACISHTLSS